MISEMQCNCTKQLLALAGACKSKPKPIKKASKRKKLEKNSTSNNIKSCSTYKTRHAKHSHTPQQ